MTRTKKSDNYIFSIGTLLLTLVAVNISLWIYLASATTQTFEQTKNEYLSFFPKFLQNAFLITVIDIVLLGAAMYCFSLSKKSFKRMATLLMIISGILLFWQVFSLM